MKELLRMSGFLGLVAAVAGLTLAGTARLTKGKIEAARSDAETVALGDVLPLARSFRPTDSHTVGLDAAGETVGFVFKVKAPGYASVMEALVGVDTGGAVTGIKVLYQNETPGLGDKVALPGFLGQFTGRRAAELKLKKDGGAIDAVTSATISSRALTNAVQERIDEFEKRGR